ncbi:MAG: hypothetical protein B7O98_02960 [Zestosphaera tikiterensis]|uniref:DUF106 domain-containing protein n=1 Tax=Zestosphaera tikiterensis TaxID=1973259 RepID=A0A2R7Y791_9CREN|nr:MAG: hypothetical protein B7O98_02960 [Zestosphaera tikiterensis]
MLTVLYVMTIVATVLPWSYLVKWYAEGRLKIKDVVKELRELEKEASSVSGKEKKAKILEARIKVLRGKLSNFFLVNLLALWAGIFISLFLTRYTYIASVIVYGSGMPIPSPIDLPIISEGGVLNDLFLYLATLIGYQTLHNRIVGLDYLRRGTQ